MNHVGVYWTDDSWYGPWLQGLASRFRLIQYDSRGQGMSSRGLPTAVVWDDFGEDLRVVVDRLQLDGGFIGLQASPPLTLRRLENRIT